MQVKGLPVVVFVLHMIMCLSISLRRKRKIQFYMNMCQSINLDSPPFWILRVMLPTEMREGRRRLQVSGAGGGADWLVTCDHSWGKTSPRLKCCLFSLTCSRLLSCRHAQLSRLWNEQNKVAFWRSVVKKGHVNS